MLIRIFFFRSEKRDFFSAIITTRVVENPSAGVVFRMFTSWLTECGLLQGGPESLSAPQRDTPAVRFSTLSLQ